MIDKLDFNKIKIFCSVKNTVKRLRRQVTDRVKIFAKEDLSKIYKELL